ncbi:MAG: 3-hydroxyacyl-ACP dehydratase FabZ family protein [Armatimonadota bacterium]|nr:3-hydroxyacyl-ACP dehydratase FabZ family protein [Armatimonadota bacterium]
MRFLMVDTIVDLVPGRSVHAVKTLSPEEELFRDHFPGFPVVPGVLLTEMMAQAAGKCLDAEDVDRGKAMLAQIRSASFRRWVRPGERIDIHAEIKASAPSHATARCWIAVGGERAADAELFFSFLRREALAAGYRDEVLDRYHAARGVEDMR